MASVRCGLDTPGSRLTSRRAILGGRVGVVGAPTATRPDTEVRHDAMDSQATQQPPTQPNAPPSHAPEDGEPEFVVCIHLGAESVFFYPPGSAQEHLVIEHGIPSVDMHW